MFMLPSHHRVTALVGKPSVTLTPNSYTTAIHETSEKREISPSRDALQHQGKAIFLPAWANGLQHLSQSTHTRTAERGCRAAEIIPISCASAEQGLIWRAHAGNLQGDSWICPPAHHPLALS